MDRMYQIEVDYQRTKQQAEQLSGVGEKLKGLAAGQLNGVLGEVQRAWSGDSADAFLQKGRTLQRELSVQAGNLQRTALLIARHAQRVRTAEQNALQRAAE